MKKKHSFSGIHLLGEFFGVNKEILDNEELLKEIFIQSVSLSGATTCSVCSKKFSPKGITILLLLSESHASIHTYPEKECFFFDIFTCGSCDPNKSFDFLIRKFSPSNYQKKIILRK